MDKKSPKTVETLRAAAEQLGVSRDRARELFKAKGLNGTFDPSKYSEYMAVLVTESSREKALEALRTKIVNLNTKYELPECPICGKPMERAPKWDRFFKKYPVGMSCSEGGVSHFLLSVMQPVFTRFAEKWRVIEEQYALLKDGKITQTEYEERINKWSQTMSQ